MTFLVRCRCRFKPPPSSQGPEHEGQGRTSTSATVSDGREHHMTGRSGAMPQPRRDDQLGVQRVSSERCRPATTWFIPTRMYHTHHVPAHSC